MILGIVYHNNLNDLIYLAINITKLTHVNGISILGAVSSALFCYYIINKVNIFEWIFELIKLFRSENFRNIYISNTGNDKKFLIDLEYFITQLEKYIDFRFDKKSKKIKRQLFFKDNGARYQFYF